MITLRDAAEFDSLLQPHLDGNSIGELVRKGHRIYYAFIGGVYFESPSRHGVAYRLALASLSS